MLRMIGRWWIVCCTSGPPCSSTCSSLTSPRSACWTTTGIFIITGIWRPGLWCCLHQFLIRSSAVFIKQTIQCFFVYSGFWEFNLGNIRNNQTCGYTNTNQEIILSFQRNKFPNFFLPSYFCDQLRKQWLYSKLRQFSFHGHKNSNNRSRWTLSHLL